MNKTVYIIHDRAGEFFLIFEDYNIKGITTSVCAPNMNAIAERFVRSARQEVLDHFVIFSEKQIFNLLKEYIIYYNSIGPHQGINQDIPEGFTLQKSGTIKSLTILFGLHHDYYRKAA